MRDKIDKNSNVGANLTIEVKVRRLNYILEKVKILKLQLLNLSA